MFMPSFVHTRRRRSAQRSVSVAPLAAVLVAGLGLALAGCNRGQTPPAPVAAPDVAATPPKPAASVCKASASWITSPSEPAEVAPEESFCDFYQFSWQWFLAQVSPADKADPAGNRVFETNRLHNPNVKSGQCSLPLLLGRASAAKLIAERSDKPQDFEDTQADGNALYDQNGNILYYNIWYSKAMCESSQQGFAPGTFEIKVSWMVLPKPDPTFFTMQAVLPGTKQQVTLGMVGFHLANWTSKHPEMIWATWEHKRNAPLCDGSSAMPAEGWSFAAKDAAQCLTANPQPTAGPPSANCASFKFNTPNQQQDPQPPTGAPNNVCRQYASGNQPGTSINGNDNAANLAAIDQLNDQLVGPNGLLTQLPDTDPMAIWKHYELIGAIWTKGGASSGNPPIPYTVHEKGGVDKIVPGDKNSLQRGSLELTNMSMETFQQGDTSWAPNCFGCHQFKTEEPLDVSHICQSLFSQDAGGNCVVPPAGPQAGAPAATADPAKSAAAAKK